MAHPETGISRDAENTAAIATIGRFVACLLFRTLASQSDQICPL